LFIQDVKQHINLYAYCGIDEHQATHMESIDYIIQHFLFTTGGGLRSLQEPLTMLSIIIYGAYADDWTAYPSNSQFAAIFGFMNKTY
jgi:hypothetical protein